MYWILIRSSLDEFSSKDLSILLNLEISRSLTNLGNLNNLRSLVNNVDEMKNKVNGNTDTKSMKKEPL